MLFNFQGPRCLVDSLFILAHRFFFVNTFLKLFLKFFVSALKNRFAMRFFGGLSATRLAAKKTITISRQLLRLTA